MKFSRAIITGILIPTTTAQEPNPPSWPSSVSIFDPSMSNEDISQIVEAAYAVNGGDPRTTPCGNGEFSDERFAFFFQPGTYTNLDIPVGYYTSVYGLGTAPTDTVFEGSKGVFCEQSCKDYTSGALGTFWRSAENFHSTSSYKWDVGTGMSWVVSQAAPLRNVKVDNDLLFFEYLPESCCAAGYASGGWASGVDVYGKTSFGSQQQFMIRNSHLHGNADTPVWNGVFLASESAPQSQCGQGSDYSSTKPSISNKPSVPLNAEKPYITSSSGRYQLVVPPVKAEISAGLPWTESGFADSRIIDFSDVFVATVNDTADIIQEKLDKGLHVVLTPGIYSLDKGLLVQVENQVILGLGYATLTAPINGDPAITIGDVSGVRVAAVLVQAGKWETRGALVQVGISGTFVGDISNPTVLTDIFVRVGGNENDVGPVQEMVKIESGFTVMDNNWLWRADHGVDGLVYNSDNPVKNGLVVKADNVYTYGLAVEHTLEDNVIWDGDNGETYFFQAEIMYDYLEDVWDHDCYKIGANVTSHFATGLGCYSFFRDSGSKATAGFSKPDLNNVKIDKACSIFLNGAEGMGSGILNLINDDGKYVNASRMWMYHCDA